MAQVSKSIVGVVVSAGKMQRAVKVRTAKQVFHPFIQKHFQSHQDYLVSDPNSSLRLGDVVRAEDEGRKLSRRIRHVVAEIIAPWGPRVEERPPVLTKLERQSVWQEKYDAKRARRGTQNPPIHEPTRAVPNTGHREGSREARDVGRQGQVQE